MTTIGNVFPQGWPDRRPPTAEGRPADLELAARNEPRQVPPRIRGEMLDRYRTTLGRVLDADVAVMRHTANCQTDPCLLCEQLARHLDEQMDTARRMVTDDLARWSL